MTIFGKAIKEKVLYRYFFLLPLLLTLKKTDSTEFSVQKQPFADALPK